MNRAPRKSRIARRRGAKHEEKGADAARNETYRTILKVVAAIPRGRVTTYAQVAWRAGLPGRARLVGRVLADAPAALALPWHRVINAQGRIALPKSSRSYLEQRSRLREEGIELRKDRVDLRRYGWALGADSPLLD